jgi:hypothetical protein
MNRHLRDTGLLRQVYAILVVDGIWESGKNKNVGDLRLAEDRLEDQHDGAVPSVVPIRLLPDHRWHDKYLGQNEI